MTTFRFKYLFHFTLLFFRKRAEKSFTFIWAYPETACSWLQTSFIAFKYLLHFLKQSKWVAFPRIKDKRRRKYYKHKSSNVIVAGLPTYQFFLTECLHHILFVLPCFTVLFFLFLFLPDSLVVARSTPWR